MKLSSHYSAAAAADAAAQAEHRRVLAEYLAAGVPEEEAQDCAQFAAGLVYDRVLG